jgi:pimeloyl-ACP methyl ester carboxylesterase
MKQITTALIIILSLLLLCPVLAQAAPAVAVAEKQLNFVFLHGYNGNDSALQLLEDAVVDKLPAYVTNYQYDNPGIAIQSDTLRRSYPNNVDIDTWAKNIADSINRRFKDKNNIVLIGHSMGGKTALYAVANNIGGIADKVAMVVTINSPIKCLVDYYYIGGDSCVYFWGAQLVIKDEGALESLVNYDSSQDGQWVASHKHWLALISSESYPDSSQFDTGGIDPLPRIMDDSIVPISCQYADGADVVYYGEYAHSDYTEKAEVSAHMADEILGYIFDKNQTFSALARSGSFEHKAGLLPGTTRWQDIVGDVLFTSGTLVHENTSYFKLDEWEDVVGDYITGDSRSRFQITQIKSFPLFTGITQSGWLSDIDYQDGRIYIKSRAAPQSKVQVDWSVYQQGFLPEGIERDHYEVEIETGSSSPASRQ